MPKSDQLEIIKPNGEIDFYDLDAAKGITNIGRHPDNDVVIAAPNVPPFYAVLDHRKKPFEIVVLDDTVATQFAGISLPANVSTALQNWDTLEVAGHRIILLENDTGEDTIAQPWRLAAAQPDVVDDFIVAELSPRSTTVAVEQPAGFEVTVINGGSIVASFDTAVEGLKPEWITITPAEVNLNEGQRATVQVQVLIPRHPSSIAGVYRVALNVTSPNYARRSTRLGAKVTVSPYFAFKTDGLIPRLLRIPWHKQTAHTTMPVTNRGNSPVVLQLTARDDEGACHFEFERPGGSARVPGKVEVAVQPNRTVVVPVHITLAKRPLIALQPKTHAFTVIVALQDSDYPPQSLPGQLKIKPLIGPLLVAVVAFGIAILSTDLFVEGGIAATISTLLNSITSILK